MTRKFNLLISLIGVMVTSFAYPQAARTVMVQSNSGALLFPTNLWSANAVSARSGLALAAHATNPVVPVASGGTGATNAAGARTNLGLGFGALTNTNASSFRSDIGIPLAALTNTNLSGFLNSIGLADSSEPTFLSLTLTEDTNTLVMTADPAITRTNLGLPWSGLTNTSASGFRSALSVSATWLTNTNVTNFRTAIGLGADDSPQFDDISSSSANISQISADAIGMNGAISWTGTNATANAATTRTNLSLGLPALTNTNVTNFRTAILPTYSGNTNRVLSVNASGTDVEWVVQTGGGNTSSVTYPLSITDGGTGATNSAAARTNLGLGATWLTNTNVTNVRTAIGLGATNDVTFRSVNYDGELTINNAEILGWGQAVNFEERRFAYASTNLFDWGVEGKITIGWPLDFVSNSVASTTRANLGFSTNLNTLWTATNAADARTALSIGTNGGSVYNQDLNTTNNVSFNAIHIERDANSGNYTLTIGQTNTGFKGIGGGPSDFVYVRDEANILGLYSGEIHSLVTHRFSAPMVLNYGAGNTAVLQFGGIDAATGAAISRTNLGLPLPALTNTSNVTAMRALSGSTNTNHPFSGSVSVVGTNNTNTLVFSNGILQSVQ